jgi:hypothetical protein
VISLLPPTDRLPGVTGPAERAVGQPIPAYRGALMATRQARSTYPGTDSSARNREGQEAETGRECCLLARRFIRQRGQYLVPSLLGEHVAGAGTDALGGVVGVEIEDAYRAVAAGGV